MAKILMGTIGKATNRSKNGKIVCSRIPESGLRRGQIQFSFIVPVWNGEKTIGATLSSLASQKHASFEIIVVDNASADGTKRVVRAFSNVRYVLCKDRGRSQARNFGARLARGSYLAFIDADVILAPDWLEKIVGYLKTPVDALATRVVPQSEGDTALDRYRTLFASWKSRGTFLSVRSRSGAYPLINTAACVVKRSAFERVGGFDETLMRHEDLDLSFRLFLQGFLLGGVSKAHSEVRFVSEGGPLSRELAYLTRSLEVQSSFLSDGRRPINFSLQRTIWQESRCFKTLAFAWLDEVARQIGAFQRRHSPMAPRTWKTLPGRNVLASAFSYRGQNYVLKEWCTFLFVDSSVFLCRGPLTSRRLNFKTASAIRSLYAGRSISPAEAQVLLKLGIYNPAGGTPTPYREYSLSYSGTSRASPSAPMDSAINRQGSA